MMTPYLETDPVMFMSWISILFHTVN